MIAGVRGRATDLAQGQLIAEMAQAGIDHVNLLYLSADPQVHDALAGVGDHQKTWETLEAIRDSEVCAVVEIPFIEATVRTIDATLAGLGSHGFYNAAFYAIASQCEEPGSGALTADALVQDARIVEELSAKDRVRYLWYPPLRYDPSTSLADQVRGGPRCSGDSAVRIEPDGSVIPARGPCQSAGNLLSDEWETIIGSDTFQDYRRRLLADTHCDHCPGLTICAADCPRNPAGWAEASKECR
jgi:radical SAM protein with 4Fe4S-binding SPASM domain